MSDPERLKDHYALLRRASATPAPTSADRAAILAGIGASVAPAASATSAAKGGSIFAGKTLLACLGSVLAMGGIATVIVLSQAPPPPHAPTTRPVLVAPPPTAVETAPVPLPAESTVTAPEAPRPPPSAKPRASAGTVDNSLAAESALVDKARASLESSPDAALALVEDHARRFPRGELAAERDFLRIKALRRLGRTDEARKHASAYAGRHPSSPYTPSVRTMLDELGGSK